MANNERMLRLGFELSGEEKFKQGLSQVNQGLQNVKAAQTNLASEFDAGDKSLAKYTQAHELLANKLTLQRQKMQLIKTEYDKVAASQGANSAQAQRLARQYEYASAECNNTERALHALDEEARESQNVFNRLRTALEENDGVLKRVGDSMVTVGKKLTAALAGVSAAVAAGIKLYMDYDDALASLSTIADTSAVSLEELGQQAIEASNNTGVATKAIIEGAYSAVSAGVDTADAMGYMEVAAKAAKAGMSDINTVVDGSTSIMNAWGMATSDATSVFEKMIVAQNLGKTTLGAISSQIGQLTGIAPTLNMSLDETLSAVAALTKNGVQTSSAITGLRGVLSAVMKPTAEAAKAAEELGLDFSVAAFRSKGLTGFLADVMEKTGGSSDALAKLFGSVEGLSQVMLLGGAAAEDYANTLSAMGSASGSLDDAFSARTSSKAEQLSAALNRVKNEGIALGQTMAPLLDLAANALNKVTSAFEGMDEGQQKFVFGAMGILAVVGPLTVGAGKLVQAISSIKAVLTALGAVGAGPFGLILAGVTAAGVALSALTKKYADFMQGKDKSATLKAAFDVSVDSSAIDEAIASAEEVQHEMELNIKLKAEFEQTGDEIMQQAEDMLTGAMNEDTLTNEVDAWLAPVYEQFEQYGEVTGGTLKDTLDGYKQEYIDYATELMNQDGPVTDEQLAHLQELKGQLDGFLNNFLNFDLSQDATSLNDEIITWLTDGKAETEAQKSEYSAKVEAMMQPYTDAITETFDNKKAELDLYLATGIIDKATYDRQLGELQTSTEGATLKLQTASAEYTNYMLQLANSGKEPTEEQIAELERLKQNVIDAASEVENYDFVGQGTAIGENLVAGMSAATTAISISDEELAEWKGAVDEWVDPIMNAIDEQFATKKESLDNAFASGLIDKETYDAKLTELETSTNQMKDSLNTEKDAYVAYVDAIAANGMSATEEELARLQEIHDEIITMGEDLLDATDTATMAAKASYTLVSSGNGNFTTEDVAVATKYIMTNDATARAAAEDIKTQAQAALQAEWEKGGMDQVEFDDRMLEIQTNYDDMIAAADEAYMNGVNAIAEGISAKYPEATSQMEQLAKDQNLYDAYLQAQTDFENGDIDMDAYRLKLGKIYGQLFDLGNNYILPNDFQTPEILKTLNDGFADTLAGDVSGIDWSGVMTDWSAGISSGMLDNVNADMMGAPLKTALTAIDLADDGETVGENLIKGVESGVELTQTELNEALIAGATQANEAFKTAEGINSPSTVYAEYGGYLMEGLVNGIKGMTGEVVSAMDIVVRRLNAFKTKFTIAGRQTVDGLISGALSRRSLLILTYERLAEAALKAAKDKLQINSPSKVFEEVGAFTGEGFILGVNKKAQAAKRAMTAMVDPSGIGTDKSTAHGAPAVQAGNTYMTVNYTGAVTERDTRKLALRLGEHSKRQNKAKGVK